jgi:hypothetical protein
VSFSMPICFPVGYLSLIWCCCIYSKGITCVLIKYLHLSSKTRDFTCTGTKSLPITVATQCKAWAVFACLNTGIMGSNQTRGMDVSVRLFCVCFILCVGSGLAMDWSPVQGVLPTVWSQKRCLGKYNVTSNPLLFKQINK